MGQVLEHLDFSHLISQSRAGDSVAIDALVSACQTQIYRLALSMLDDSAEADEATQEALIVAVDRLDSYRGESAFMTWLYAIALNVCRGRLRKRRARERLASVLRSLGLLGGAEPPPEQAVIQHEADTSVWRAVRALDDKQREAVILRYYHDLRLEEIARLSGVSERTVRNRLYAAHERLRTLLKANDDFE